MIRTLYNPAVEQMGIEKGMKIGMKMAAERIAINLFKIGISIENIMEATELPYEKVVELKNKR